MATLCVSAVCGCRWQVDTNREAVLVPLYGQLVPFHIMTVRNISSNQDGDHAYIRLNFNYGPSFEPCTRDPQAMLLKELSFRTSDLRHASKVGAPVTTHPCLPGHLLPGVQLVCPSSLSSQLH